MNIPEVPQMFAGHGNFITAQAWTAVVESLKELDKLVTDLQTRVTKLEKRTAKLQKDLGTVAGALQGVVENA